MSSFEKLKSIFGPIRDIQASGKMCQKLYLSVSIDLYVAFENSI